MSKKRCEWAYVVCVEGVYYATCPTGLSEAYIKTASGREIRFPKLPKGVKQSDAVLHTWMRTEALIEAHAHNDDHCFGLFAALDPLHLTTPDLNDLNDYLFDPQRKRRPNGLYVITAPLRAVQEDI